ncbi:MaoC/PaaZ C-terminal domain-containing protein [Variovorax sp. GT1P44]|uniref:MaoC/PaaZ C-terminal domain-containing protein n=1 Tax=Variovorax sp. GT1P44 TaxID=3443742 RepID=UPI003F45A447
MNLQNVIERSFEATAQHYDWRDSALYALGLGIGSDPLDEDELPYVFEGRAQHAVPSQCMVLGWPPFWHADPDAAIDWVNILHGEQRFVLHRPLPLDADIRATHRVRAVVDKGVGRGALIYFDTEIADARSGEALASLNSTQYLRGDGGCGNHGEAPQAVPPLRDGAVPSASIEYRTAPQAALLYRLVSRDYMPIHADPEIARRAGFDRPISHGLNTMGLACRAILKRFSPGHPERLRSMFVRFAQPAYPGEIVRVDLFDEGDTVRFRAVAVERDVIVLDRGECRFSDQ